MILATTTVENVDQFLEVFGTKGADKRALHGSKGSTVFRDPTEENRVWALFDWDEAGWAKFVSDPYGPADPQGSRTRRQARSRVAPRLLRRVRGTTMATAIKRPARVGLITDQTGALSFMGIANVNLAKMVIDDINARGGLLGRPIELFVEDSATDDDVAEAGATKLVEREVDVVVGGIYSSTRQAIKGPVVDQAGKLYLYPEQYEGQECHPLIFCTGPVPAQQIEPFFPWLMRETGREELLHAVGRLHLAAHAQQEGAGGRRSRRRRDRRGGVLPARSHRLRTGRRRHHVDGCRRRVQHDCPARPHAVPRAAAPTPASPVAVGSSSAPTSTRTS